VLKLTFGAELEFADVKYGQPLPEGNAWNRQDDSLVNSNGIANCPIGKYWPYGGEINTKPTDTVREQTENFMAVVACLDPAPVINYRCNLHIHVGLRGLRDDLEMLKKLLRYIDTYQLTIWQLIERIPEPKREEYYSFPEYAGAMRRYKRRKQSHQSVLSPRQVAKMLAAKNTEEFYLTHFNFSRQGVPQKHLHQRCGINLRSLWENDETIEFRHFPGTLDPVEFNTCVTWCEQFMKTALDDQDHPLTILEAMGKPRFPQFKKYDHILEQGYEQTSHHQPIAVRKANIERLSHENAPTTA
jgi:hypothetical protein